jgi:hypothetical protein
MINIREDNHVIKSTGTHLFESVVLIIVFCNDDHYHCLKEKNYSYQSKYRGYRLQPLK